MTIQAFLYLKALGVIRVIALPAEWQTDRQTRAWKSALVVAPVQALLALAPSVSQSELSHKAVWKSTPRLRWLLSLLRCSTAQRVNLSLPLSSPSSYVKTAGRLNEWNEKVIGSDLWVCLHEDFTFALAFLPWPLMGLCLLQYNRTLWPVSNRPTLWLFRQTTHTESLLNK